MKYGVSTKLMWSMLIKDIKTEMNKKYPQSDVKLILKTAKKQYAEIVKRTPSIGGLQNPMTMILVAAIILVAIYLAVDKSIELDTLECIYHKACEKNFLFRMYIKSESKCFTKKYQEKLSKNSKASKKTAYEWDWKYDYIPSKTGSEYGTDFYTCGICKLMTEEGVEELTIIMCNLDYVIAHNAGAVLIREHTIAKGNSCCDFRYSKKL